MESAATLSWLWVIETLADFKQADLSLLRALISRVPDFLTDASEAVRERVAMRYLEECMGSGRADVPSTTSPGPRINAARSSEEVLSSHFMKDANLGSLEKCGNELSSQDIHQFILQKRAALPKSAIDLLRESILGHCQPSIVLSGYSGLSRSCRVDNVRCNDDGEHEHVNMLKISTVDSETHSQIPGTITLAPDSTNLDLQEEPFRTENDLLKQNVSYVDSRNHLQRDIATTGGNDVLLLEKGSTDQLPGEKTIGLSDGEIQLVNQASALAADSGSVSFQDPSAYTKQLNEQSVSDCERRNNVQFSRHSSVPQPSNKDNISLQQAPLNGSGKNVNRSLCKSTHFDGDLAVIPDTPSNGGSDDVPSNFDPNDEMFTAEKHHLVNSQIHVDHDSIAGDRSKQGLCIKCDKGGRLLSCSARDCSITVHESCLGPSFNFNGTELFYCPFCSYARATIAYCKARKNHFQATKALAAFTGEVLVQGDCMELTLTTILGETNQARAVGNMNYQHSFYSHEHCRDKSNGNVLEEKEHQTEVNVCYKGNSSGRFSEAPPINAMRYVSHNIEEPNLVEVLNDNQDITQVQQHTAKTMNNGQLPYEDKVSTPTSENAAVTLINMEVEIGNNCRFNRVAEHRYVAQSHATADDGNLPHEDVDAHQTTHDFATMVQKDGIGTVNNFMNVEKLRSEEPIRALDYGTDQQPSASHPSKRHAKIRRYDAAVSKIHQPQEPIENPKREKTSSGSSSKCVLLKNQEQNRADPGHEDDWEGLNSKSNGRRAKRVRNDAALGTTHYSQETVENLKEEKFLSVSSKRRVAQPESVEYLKEEKFSSVRSKRSVAQPETVENLKEENFSSVSSRRRVAQPKPLSNQRITPGRREKIFWTSEEEETLKSAVQRFADGDENYPWRKILEFGRKVFHTTRRPGDLKDKWRNIMKKEVKET